MTGNPLFSTWLGGHLPISANAASTGAAMVQRRIKQGRQTRIKNKDELLGPKYFNSLFIAQLDCALVDRAFELQSLHETKSMPSRLASLTHDFFADVVKSNDATTKHKGQSPPRTLKNAEQLTVLLANFKLQVAQLIPVSEWGLLLCMVLDDLNGDIEHFVRNIRITSGIEMVIDGEPKIRNRPKNQGAQLAFASILVEHMAQHGPAEYPKPAAVRRRLQQLGHIVKERTLRDWKKQVKIMSLEILSKIEKRQ